MRRIFAAFLAIPVLLGSIGVPLTAFAEALPFSVRQAVVKVICGEWQGSGVVVNADDGYILTNAHLVVDTETGALVHDHCRIAYLPTDGTTIANVYYDADVEKYVYDESQNRDFAILKIGGPRDPNSQIPNPPFLKTDEFSETGDSISLIGYPGSANSRLTITTGKITDLWRGIVKTDAEISPGMSGGAGINSQNNLIGLATRILYREIAPGVEEVVDYELVDIRAILSWIDTFGVNLHDTYVTHADPERYHGPAQLIVQDRLTCQLLARSPIDTTVYCLQADGTRRSFPNDTVYYSWFSDFSGVQMLQPSELAPYRLTSNITMKPGSLIKVQTDPKVYVVSDILGTLRWVTTEDKITELYGEGWAGFVKDVPDTFFTNYRVGSPIE